MNYKKKNGFYKHYNKDGISTRIRIVHDKIKSGMKDIMIIYCNKNEVVPNLIVKSGFTSDSQVINYILKNLENKDMVFDIRVKY